MKTIIAATDFSDNSLRAVDYAAAMSCFTGDKLTLFHVCPLPLAFGEVPVPVVTKEELITEATQEINKLKEKILLDTHNRITVNTVIKEGELVSQLEKYCAKKNVFAVVMGSETAPPIERFLIGGRTTSAVHRLSAPLIIVPEDARFSGIKKIGLACDLTEVVESIPLKQIEDLVNTFKSELHVIHVNTDEKINERAIIEESHWLEAILKKFNPRYHFIASKDVENTINNYVDRHKFDLLILIPKNHGIISRIFQHSHSKKLVLRAHIPMMSIHE